MIYGAKIWTENSALKLFFKIPIVIWNSVLEMTGDTARIFKVPN